MKKLALILSMLFLLTGCASRFEATADNGIISLRAKKAQSSGVTEPFVTNENYVKISSSLEEGILYISFYSDEGMDHTVFEYEAEGTEEHIEQLAPGTYTVHISTGLRVTGTLSIEECQNP